MSPVPTPAAAALLKARLRVPQHVVYRAFPTETVVLNLQTGRYHGLNPTAGAMLEALQRAGSIDRAAAIAAREYGQTRADVERDICDLCGVFLERGLIEIEEA